MGHTTLAIALILVTILYLLVMIFLFWRFRVSMRQLAERWKACEDQEQKEAASAGTDPEEGGNLVICKRRQDEK